MIITIDGTTMLIIILCVILGILLVIWILTKISSLWCDHDYKLQNKMSTEAPIYKCTKCGKIKAFKY
jgi:hypothetical protein